MKNKILVSGISDVGPKREHNQDNYYVFGRINDNGVLHDVIEEEKLFESIEIIAVFDGMGGEHDGEKASLSAAQNVNNLESVLENYNEIDIVSLTPALERYYDGFKKELKKKTDDLWADSEVCGTTCVFSIFFRNSIIPIWIGDSRMYLLREGRLCQVTKDHTFAQERIDSGELNEEDAKLTPAWHMLTKYMGGEKANFSIGRRIDIQNGDRVILCSDGLSDMYDKEQLIKTLQGDTKLVFQRIQHDINEKAEDNCTVVIADIICDDETYSVERALNGVKKSSEKLFKTIMDRCLSDNT